VVWYHSIRMIARHWPFSEAEIMSAVSSDSSICFQVKNEGREYLFSRAHSWANGNELTMCMSAMPYFRFMS
jgi:hypothetical protein